MKHPIVILAMSLASISASAQTEQHVTDSTGDTAKLYRYIEVMPYPKYNVSAYLTRNLEYPSKARRAKVEGRVVVSFLVDEKGKIKHITTVGEKLGYGLEEEAMRVVYEMPKWVPGTQNGRPVSVEYKLPISFKLQY
jgi:TonB family protein